MLLFLDFTVGLGNQSHVGFAVSEQAVGDDAWDLVDFLFQFHWVKDLEVVDVDDLVAVVGNKTFTVDGLAAEFDHLTGHKTPCHGQNLNGQRESAQYVDTFAFINDTDKFLTGSSDDFFSG